MEILDILNILLSFIAAYYLIQAAKISRMNKYFFLSTAVSAIVLRLVIAFGVSDIYQKSLAAFFWLSFLLIAYELSSTKPRRKQGR